MKEFIEKVRNMRTAQATYFRTRQRADLTAAKKAETEVDQMIQEFDRKAKQEPTLFP